MTITTAVTIIAGAFSFKFKVADAATVKLIVADAPMFPAWSMAYIVTLCDPVDKLVSLNFLTNHQSRHFSCTVYICQEVYS